MKHRNTLEKGSYRYIVFHEDGSWYASCLEFNIIEAGDTPEEAFLLMSDAAQGYLASARKIKARPDILNQKADPEYEKMWGQLQEAKKPKYEVFSFGRMNTAVMAV